MKVALQTAPATVHMPLDPTSKNSAKPDPPARVLGVQSLFASLEENFSHSGAERKICNLSLDNLLAAAWVH